MWDIRSSELCVAFGLRVSYEIHRTMCHLNKCASCRIVICMEHKKNLKTPVILPFLFCYPKTIGFFYFLSVCILSFSRRDIRNLWFSELWMPIGDMSFLTCHFNWLFSWFLGKGEFNTHRRTYILQGPSHVSFIWLSSIYYCILLFYHFPFRKNLS